MSDEPRAQSGQVDLTPEGGPLDEGVPNAAPGAGQVRLTPEGGPLDQDAGEALTPPTLRDHLQDPILGLDDTPASATGTRTGPTTPPSATGAAREEPAAAAGQGVGEAPRAEDLPARTTRDDDELKQWPPYSGKPVNETHRDAWRYAAPVVSQAENLAIKAIDLSGRGLTRLARFLEERREGRDASEEQQQRDSR